MHPDERKVIEAFVDEVLSRPDHSLTLFDGDEYPVENSRDREAILSAMGTVNDEVLAVFANGKSVGAVRFVYGNSPWEVICNYTISLEYLMPATQQVEEKLMQDAGVL